MARRCSENIDHHAVAVPTDWWNAALAHYGLQGGPVVGHAGRDGTTRISRAQLFELASDTDPSEERDVLRLLWHVLAWGSGFKLRHNHKRLKGIAEKPAAAAATLRTAARLARSDPQAATRSSTGSRAFPSPTWDRPFSPSSSTSPGRAPTPIPAPFSTAALPTVSGRVVAGPHCTVAATGHHVPTSATAPSWPAGPRRRARGAEGTSALTRSNGGSSARDPVCGPASFGRRNAQVTASRRCSVLPILHNLPPCRTEQIGSSRFLPPARRFRNGASSTRSKSEDSGHAGRPVGHGHRVRVRP